MTKPTEAFNLELKLAFLAAVFVAAPFILAQVWLFIAPGLYKHERRYALPFMHFFIALVHYSAVYSAISSHFHLHFSF